MGNSAIVSGTDLDTERQGGSFSFLLAAGSRPGADACRALLAAPPAAGGQAATISHQPPADEGWLELLASGLTFELSGLAPRSAPALPPARFFYGLPHEATRFALEPFILSPGPHIAAGAHSLPVARVMAALAARFAGMHGIKAVCWHPAGTWMAPDYFVRVVSAWLAGGGFPALGLTALEREADGDIRSHGLAFFIGQELWLDRDLHENAAAAIKLAVRIIDRLVGHGRLTSPVTIEDLHALPLAMTPERGGTVLRVRAAGS